MIGAPVSLPIASRLLALAVALMFLPACGGSPAQVVAPDVPPSSTPVPEHTRASIPTASPMPTLTPVSASVPQPTPEGSPTRAAISPTSSTLPTPLATATTAVVSASATPVDDSASDEERPLVIVLDPGHDRSSPGALGIEYQFVLHAAFIAKEALEAAGYEVHLTREDNNFVFSEHPELLPPNAADMHPGYGMAYAHATKALEFEPDLILILHFNGHPNPDVRGIEVYYCEMGGPQNLVLAEIITEELVDALQSIGYNTPSTRIAEDLTVARGNRHFPSMGNVYDPPTHWVENRYAGIPVVLTEPLYMTNPIERPLLDDDATHQAIADAYVRAVNRYFGR